MDSGVFLEDNERIHNFVQLTYVALSGTGAVPLRRLEDAYRAMEPTIHERLAGPLPDCAALRYAIHRLPECITRVRRVVLGQSESILEEGGIPMSAWTEVSARARRRRYLYDGGETLICFIASKSDVDDIIPALVALQVEWNKIHALLAEVDVPETLPADDSARAAMVGELLRIPPGDGGSIASTFGDGLARTLAEMKRRPMDLHVRNFEASYCRYRRETETWWRQIQAACPGLEDRPVYFVSSNTHSLINLLSGYAEESRDEILEFATADPELRPLLDRRRAANGGGDAGDPDLFYYLLMKYEQDDPSGVRTARRIAREESLGVTRITADKTLDIPTQVVDLRVLAASGAAGAYASRLAALHGVDAMVLNIDYPLGRTAYFILNKLAEHIARLRGVYVIGKAASLFADRGDIIIPSSIIDQHTRNRYFFENSMRVSYVEPHIDAGSHGIYDNQKAVTVLGTFLQNRGMLNSFLAAGVTDLEMEAGPYLAAMYEIARPKRYPENETVSLRLPDTDIGIIHYVSDNPLAGRHLDRRLELDGVDATYAATRAVLDRILEKESDRAADR